MAAIGSGHTKDGGFALLLVLWIVTILAAVVITFVSSVAAQSRAASGQRDALAAEQLAISAQEMLPFLAARGFGTASEDLTGMPVEVILPAFHYRIQFPAGTVDLYLESDNGKINPGTANLALLESFFSRWTQDSARGSSIAAAIVDWRDPDTDPEVQGAEAAAYTGLGYGPRNAVPGIGDIVLIHGLLATDFLPDPRRSGDASGLPAELLRFLTTGPTASAINPNFASEMVLQSVPGLTDLQVQTILQLRQETFFNSRAEFEAKTGILPGSRAAPYFAFGRGGAPAVLTIARLKGTAVRRSLRRVYFAFSRLNPVTGTFQSENALALVERDVFPDFAR